MAVIIIVTITQQKKTKAKTTRRSTMPGKKRGNAIAPPGSAKKIKVGASVKVKTEPKNTKPSVSAAKQAAREKFTALFQTAQYAAGIPNTSLKVEFTDPNELNLAVQVINEMLAESRLQMSKTSSGELFYTMIDEEVAAKYAGLDVAAKLVLQCIEKAGNTGIWTKDIRMQTNIQQQALNKIFKQLEQRCLIKPVNSVAAKSKKLYMLYDLKPSKELTGGVWYSGLDFDHEFISELRTFVMHCTRRLNKGHGVTLTEIKSKMEQAKISKVELSLDEVRQLVQTLVYDQKIEEVLTNDDDEVRFVAARTVTTAIADFKWWDCLSPDFHFRAIKFEDGVTLSAHEPHHHTA
jgi:DNA-directed RNA polymerase III subunit RPC6